MKQTKRPPAEGGQVKKAAKKPLPAGAEPDRRRALAKAGLPAGYAQFLSDLKGRIRSAQIKAALSVNRELIQLYWDIGRSIVERQRAEGWGAAVIDRLAKDLQKAFPELKGFSSTNLWRMRAFYRAYTEEVRILPQAVGELDGVSLPPVGKDIPWGHHALIIERVKDPAQRLWYLHHTLEHGRSRNVLALQIETSLYHRQGQAVTNFERTLPPPQSDLARETLKDPYVFDFLSLGDEAHERAVEKELVRHLTRFLLELGAGFALVGEQYHLEVGDEDFYLDLLFYHTRLHCYVAIELKAGKFKAEDAGKINFYLSALDDRLRSPGDNPSIGLVLCAEKNKVLAEYALRGLAKPIGVSEYTLTRAIPEKLKTSLPTIEELEAELSQPAK